MTRSDQYLTIETPENIVLGYELVGLGARFQAALVDSLIFGLALVVTNILGGVLAANMLSEMAEGWIIALFGGLNFLVYLGYFMLFELAWNGQTPGKRIFKLRVLNANGLPVDLSATLIRNFVRLIDFLPLFYGVGVISMFVSKQSKRLGDYAAGTIVVYDQAVTLDDLARSTRIAQPIAAETLQAFDLPVDRLSEADIQLAEALLQRRHTIGTERNLLRPVLERLYSQMACELEPQMLYTEAQERLQLIVAKRRQPATNGRSPADAPQS